MNKLLAIDDYLEADCVPLCPLCDQPILDWEQPLMVSSHDTKCLTHYDCVQNIIDEMKEDE